MKIVPDQHSIFVVYSKRRAMPNRGFVPVIHRQDERGDKTACGIEIGAEWIYDFHDNTDSITCKRCLAQLTPQRGLPEAISQRGELSWHGHRG